MNPSRTHQDRSRLARRVSSLVALTALATLTASAWAAQPDPMGGPATDQPALAQTGKIDLRFVQPEQFMDIGRGSFERERNLRSLRELFARLGEGLPAGQRLQVEVTDVDLAGEIEPHSPFEVRVLRGGVDWPHISLRYTLTAGDKVLAQGEDRLSDPSYLFLRSQAAQYQPLPYEKRMLDAWFQERLGAVSAAAAN